MTGLIATLAQAQTPAPVIRSVPIEHREHLATFDDAMRRRRAGNLAKVRVIHFGDSNVAAGYWPERLRSRLQAELGNGGPGFLVPMPFGGRPAGLPHLEGGQRFSPRRHGMGSRYGPSDGLWGLAGVAVEGRSRSAQLTLVLPDGPARKIEVHALGWRPGGDFEIVVDDEEPVLVQTGRRRPQPIRHRRVLSAGAHRITVRVRTARPVRIFGVSVEHDDGLVYDGLGINGARQNAVLQWSPVWDQHLRFRDPHLIMLGYGGNEILDPHLPPERYEGQLDASLRRIRRAAPEASCLLISPVAMCGRENVAEFIEVQRRLAPAHGCAFWDASAVSGGPDSLCPWVRHGLVSPDRLHLSETGYQILGDKLADALLTR